MLTLFGIPESFIVHFVKVSKNKIVFYPSLLFFNCFLTSFFVNVYITELASLISMKSLLQQLNRMKSISKASNDSAALTDQT